MCRTDIVLQNGILQLRLRYWDHPCLFNSVVVKQLIVRGHDFTPWEHLFLKTTTNRGERSQCRFRCRFQCWFRAIDEYYNSDTSLSPNVRTGQVTSPCSKPPGWRPSTRRTKTLLSFRSRTRRASHLADKRLTVDLPYQALRASQLRRTAHRARNLTCRLQCKFAKTLDDQIRRCVRPCYVTCLNNVEAICFTVAPNY